jgi:hypothetical protein
MLASTATDLQRATDALAAKDTELQGLREAVRELNALPVSQQQLFDGLQQEALRQAEELQRTQHLQLEALRQAEAAEKDSMHAALQSQQQQWRELQQEREQRCVGAVSQRCTRARGCCACMHICVWCNHTHRHGLLLHTHREALKQQLKASQDAFGAQLAAAQQTVSANAAQHDAQLRATQQQLLQTAEREQQLRQQLDTLQSAADAKQSELDSVNQQLAAAVQATARLHDNHGKVTVGCAASAP